MTSRLAVASAIATSLGVPNVAIYSRDTLTPFLIVSVILFSTSVAYLVLWWNARDYAVFRNLGLYLALVGGSLLLPYVGIEHLGWQWQALTDAPRNGKHHSSRCNSSDA